MNTTYAQKSSTVQKTADSKAASVLDSSAQNESLQRKADMANNAAQRAEAPRPNNTGMPDNLKAGIESLSGFSMDNVRVHYNSSKPATVQALAYTQGTDIHVAPGQEKCLPHEAWHVAQQMAGRVSPTTNINGMPVNDNAALEHEADVMGEKAVQCKNEFGSTNAKKNGCIALQRMSFAAGPLADHTLQWESKGTPWHGIGGRDDKLASLVDLYKKEMLTYIANKIEKLAERKCGPHVSVVITGGVWYISVNSDVLGAGDASWLCRPAENVFDFLWPQWERINSEEKEKNKGVAESKDVVKPAAAADSDGEVRKEAAYIILRWAVSRGKKIEIINNPDTGDVAKRIHAEMRILSALYPDCKKDEDRESKLKPVWKKDEERESNMSSLLQEKGEKNVEDILAPLREMKKNYSRVVRVGGTKIPCFDCFYEMGGEVKCDGSYITFGLTGYNGDCNMVRKTTDIEADKEKVNETVKITNVSKIGDERFLSILKDGEWKRTYTASKPKPKEPKPKFGIDGYLCDVLLTNSSGGTKSSGKKKNGTVATEQDKEQKDVPAIENGQSKESGGGVAVGMEQIEMKCHGTLYKKEYGDFSKLEKKHLIDGVEERHIHGDVGKFVNVGNRYVTTMTHDHGRGNSTWSHPTMVEHLRTADFEENANSGMEQKQSYNNLSSACSLLAINLEAL
ncbi:MAG: DUF4157 domain-containing protein [Fibrobacter sp.]|nr:DUF4157 domain-containing protein [Fibrobacter sp.]